MKERKRMTTQFITDYLDKKIENDSNYIVATFYDLKVTHNLSDEELQIFLQLTQTKLANMGYLVYFTGAKYNYQNRNRIVESNEVFVAIKDEVEE